MNTLSARVSALLVVSTLLLVACRAAATPGRPPLAGDRAGLTLTPGWQGVWIADQILAPVRWVGDDAHWRMGAEFSVRSTPVRASLDISHVPLRLDGQGSAVNLSPWAPVPGTDLYFFDLRLDARWRVRDLGRWHAEAGVFLDWRVENIGNSGEWRGYAGYDGILLGPFARLSRRPTERTELSGSISLPLCDWLLRPSYLGFGYGHEWLREMRLHSLGSFRQVQLECAVRHALDDDTALEGAAGFDWTWMDISRPFRSLEWSIRLGLVIGM